MLKQQNYSFHGSKKIYEFVSRTFPSELYHFPSPSPNFSVEKKTLETFFNSTEIKHKVKKKRIVYFLEKKKNKKKDCYLWVGTCSLTTCKCSKF